MRYIFRQPLLWAISTVALELGACATTENMPSLDVNTGTSESGATPTEEPVRPTLKLPPVYSDAQTTTHPAVLALLSEATLQENNGDLEVAAAKLERALRIEPRNAVLWHHLAAVRLRQGQSQLAVSLAQKSNSFAARDSELIERNQRIIEQARLRN